MTTKPITGYRLKDGKLVPKPQRLSVSATIRQAKSKRVRVKRRTA